MLWPWKITIVAGLAFFGSPPANAGCHDLAADMVQHATAWLRQTSEPLFHPRYGIIERQTPAADPLSLWRGDPRYAESIEQLERLVSTHPDFWSRFLTWDRVDRNFSGIAHFDEEGRMIPWFGHPSKMYEDLMLAGRLLPRNIGGVIRALEEKFYLVSSDQTFVPGAKGDVIAAFLHSPEGVFARARPEFANLIFASSATTSLSGSEDFASAYGLGPANVVDRVSYRKLGRHIFSEEDGHFVAHFPENRLGITGIFVALPSTRMIGRYLPSIVNLARRLGAGAVRVVASPQAFRRVDRVLAIFSDPADGARFGKAIEEMLADVVSENVPLLFRFGNSPVYAVSLYDLRGLTAIVLPQAVEGVLRISGGSSNHFNSMLTQYSVIAGTYLPTVVGSRFLHCVAFHTPFSDVTLSDSARQSRLPAPFLAEILSVKQRLAHYLPPLDFEPSIFPTPAAFHDLADVANLVLRRNLDLERFSIWLEELLVRAGRDTLARGHSITEHGQMPAQGFVDFLDRRVRQAGWSEGLRTIPAGLGIVSYFEFRDHVLGLALPGVEGAFTGRFVPFVDLAVSPYLSHGRLVHALIALYLRETTQNEISFERLNRFFTLLVLDQPTPEALARGPGSEENAWINYMDVSGTSEGRWPFLRTNTFVSGFLEPFLIW